MIRSVRPASLSAGVLAVLGAAIFSACNSSSTTNASPAPTTISGAPQSIGNGTVSSFISLSAAGSPTAIGFRLTRAALASLPPSDTEIDVPLPAPVAGLPFKDMAIDWNPHGHPPPGIYDAPHFDFHFYTIDMATRNAVSPSDPNALAAPPPDQVPTGYVPLAPVVVPMMGVHWIDPASSEFHGKPFTNTFIYGFNDGKMIFFEPMVTTAFLATNPSFSSSIALPQTYPTRGAMYPTGYAIAYDAGTDSYTVQLTGLTMR